MLRTSRSRGPKISIEDEGIQEHWRSLVAAMLGSKNSMERKIQWDDNRSGDEMEKREHPAKTTNTH